MKSWNEWGLAGKAWCSETEDQRATFEECPHLKDLCYKAEFRSAIHMLHVFSIKVSVWSVRHFVSVVIKSQTPNYATKMNLAEVKADIQT